MGSVSRRGLRIREEGTLLPRRSELNIIGSPATAADNPTAARTDVTIASTATVTFAADSGLPVFNVKSSPYSALGDNSNDDTAEIQAAIDAASAAGGGIVFFPPGTYRISSALSVPSYVVLMGASGGAGGFGNPYLRSTSASANHLTIANGAYGVTVRNLAFDKSVTATAGAAIYSTSVGRLLIEDCFISRTYDAITLGAGNTGQGDGGNGAWINRCDINQPIHSGITMTGIIEVHVSDCYLEASIAYAESTGYGIYYGQGCDGCHFSSLDVVGYAVGIYIAGGATNGYWSKVLSDTCTLAWDIHGDEHVLVGCYAAACTLPVFAIGTYGIRLNATASAIVIQGFYCRRASTAIHLAAGASHIVINGCLIKEQVSAGDPDNGIVMAGITNAVAITGNVIDVDTDAYNDGGYAHTNLVHANNVESP